MGISRTKVRINKDISGVGEGVFIKKADLMVRTLGREVVGGHTDITDDTDKESHTENTGITEKIIGHTDNTDITDKKPLTDTADIA